MVCGNCRTRVRGVLPQCPERFFFAPLSGDVRAFEQRRMTRLPSSSFSPVPRLLLLNRDLPARSWTVLRRWCLASKLWMSPRDTRRIAVSHF